MLRREPAENESVACLCLNQAPLLLLQPPLPLIDTAKPCEALRSSTSSPVRTRPRRQWLACMEQKQEAVALRMATLQSGTCALWSMLKFGHATQIWMSLATCPSSFAGRWLAFWSGSPCTARASQGTFMNILQSFGSLP